MVKQHICHIPVPLGVSWNHPFLLTLSIPHPSIKASSKESCFLFKLVNAQGFLLIWNYCQYYLHQHSSECKCTHGEKASVSPAQLVAVPLVLVCPTNCTLWVRSYVSFLPRRLHWTTRVLAKLETNTYGLS